MQQENRKLVNSVTPSSLLSTLGTVKKVRLATHQFVDIKASRLGTIFDDAVNLV